MPHTLDWMQSVPADFDGVVELLIELNWYANRITWLLMLISGLLMALIFVGTWRG